MTLVYHTPSYEKLANRICSHGGFTKGKLLRKDFPDGEHYHRIVDDIKNKHIIIVGGTTSDADTLEIFDLACAIVKYGAKTLTMVIPYFGYSTMERATQTGEVVAAKTRARLFSAIPSACEGNKIILVDLHSEGIPYYFEGNVTVHHHYAKKEVLRLAKDFGGQDFVLASTDAGRAKWVQSLALELGVMPAFVYKQRVSGSETHLTGINADVKGKHVVIYDDMIRTGGSLISAAEAYLANGAAQVSAICTHGVLPEKSLEKLLDSGKFKNLGMTDTHARVEKYDLAKLAEKYPNTKIEIATVSESLAETLLKILN